MNGIIKGSFYGTVSNATYPDIEPRLMPVCVLQISDKVIVTCRGGRPGKKLKTIIEYKDEASFDYGAQVDI